MGHPGKSLEHCLMSFMRTEPSCQSNDRHIVWQGEQPASCSSISDFELGSINPIRDRKDAVGWKSELNQFLALRSRYRVNRPARPVENAPLLQTFRGQLPRCEQAVFAVQ